MNRRKNMAKNAGEGVRRRLQRPDGLWQKRDERTVHPMSVKEDSKPFKGIAREPDGRDASNA